MDTQFHAGAEVVCSDGPGGKLRQVIVDPTAETVTHLVVEAQAYFGMPVLVPLREVTGADSERIQLACTQAELKQMDPFEEVMFTPPSSMQSTLGYLPSQYLFPAQGNSLVGPLAAPPAQPPMVEDQVPPGEVVVGRDSAVLSSDGEELGHVAEVGTDPASGRLRHLVIRSGMLWATHEVRLPATAIAAVEEGTVRLRLSRDEVEAGVHAGEQEDAEPTAMTMTATGPAGAATMTPVPEPEARPARVVRPPEGTAQGRGEAAGGVATGAGVYVVGLFRTRPETQEAIDSLIAAGFPSDAMSAVTPEGHTVDFPTQGEQQVERGTRNTAIGAAVGALVGFAIFGPLLLVVGAVAGGLAGLLTSLGAGREQAEYLAERVRSGHFMVVVRPDGREPEAVSTLENAGATDVHQMAG